MTRRGNVVRCTTGCWRHAMAAVTIATAVCWTAPSLAVLPPVPEKKLEARSSLVAEVTVLSSKLDNCTVNGPRKRCGYTSELRVDKVLSGKGKVGSVAKIGWGTLSWVGKRPAPPGPWSSHVTFYPCERAKVFLNENPAGKWWLAGWNGKRSLGGAPAYDKLPRHPGQSGQCVHGKPVLGPAPAVPQASSKPLRTGTTGAPAGIRSKSGSGCDSTPGRHAKGCSYAPNDTLPNGSSSRWLLLLAAGALLARRRKARCPRNEPR